MEELERARGATCPQAAVAHLGLSELHFGQAQALRLARPRPALALVVG